MVHCADEKPAVICWTKGANSVTILDRFGEPDEWDEEEKEEYEEQEEEEQEEQEEEEEKKEE